MTSPRLEGGSFRDRDGRVFHRDGHVYRALSERAYAAWQAVERTAFLPRLMEAGKVVASWEAEAGAAGVGELAGEWAAVLEHAPIPFVSYPYEWSFSMLRDAALLQLELLETSLAEGVTLKDASAYNVQWQGTRPVFIDVASFEPWRQGDPWVGYRQFCELFLYPLFLTAYRDLPFQPWLRGSIDGITAEECARLLTGRDLFRPGVLTHVRLQAALQRRADAGGGSVRSELRQAGFGKDLILHNVRRLRRLVGRLRWRRERSTWADYATTHRYDASSRAAKERFVHEAAATRRWKLVWDLGANTGDFSRLVADHADYVVAMDADHLTVERLYRQLRDGGPEHVLPLLVDLADPSPALGWRGDERHPLAARGKPELTLALALLHHLVLAANLPLAEVVDWLADLGSHLVIELATEDDPMVQQLRRNKDDRAHDYGPAAFEAALASRFETLRRADILDGTRRLYFCRPRGD